MILPSEIGSRTKTPYEYFKLRNIFFKICLVSTLLLVATQPVAAKKLLRWVDENGQVQFGDKIPPEYAKGGHEILSNDGRVLDQIPRQKTPEEVAAILAEEERAAAIAKQKSIQAREDASLLRTYTSTEDIDRTLTQRVATIQAQINRDQSNVGVYDFELRTNLKNRAKYIANDEVVPHQVILNIDELRTRLKRLDDEIIKKRTLQLEITQKLRADKERFLKITQKQASNTY